MFPQSISKSDYGPDDSHPDLAHSLEQHLLAGFPPELALDLVLNELVVRAAEATRANAAALALVRGDEMVCRAATGRLAPDLGIALNPREGLSGVCLKTHQPQLSVDTESDPRVDHDISYRRGIRSILIVPIFDTPNNSQFTGVLEVFSISAAAFSHIDQKVLEGFAEDCARIRQTAFELSPHKPVPAGGALSEIALPRITEVEPASPDLIERDLVAPDFAPSGITFAPPSRYDAWSLLLGGLAILAIIGVSFMIGYRFGWLHPAASTVQIAQPLPVDSAPVARADVTSRKKAPRSNSPGKSASARTAKPDPDAAIGNDLVVYEKGKVIFRLKPGSGNPEEAKNHLANPESIPPESNAVIRASSTTRLDPSQNVRLDPDEAENRLLSRTQPAYPSAALAARRSGSVVLEVKVAEDGSVANVRTLRGDPLLAAAATDAVRSWRYQPYRQGDHPAHFQTEVTLSFTLPN